MNLIDLAERGMLPDALIRVGIRQLLSRRRSVSRGQDGEAASEAQAALRAELAAGPLAIATDLANEQHYEVPTEFFQYVLGPRLKYSCCLYEQGTEELATAEEAMLRLTAARVELEDGMDILELGCGWGSFTLWLAEQFPRAQITAVSNSQTQRRFIEHQCDARGLSNVRVLTADVCEFRTDGRFDRVVSIEMFEHLRNHRLLFERVAGWLRPDGKLFVHIFCHRDTAYLFDTEGPTDWMGRHFFSGGMMPSENLFLYYPDHLGIERQWRVGGWHYWKTCEAWLRQLDAQRKSITNLFARDVGNRQARLLVQRWRMFFMACGELFRYRQGTEWFVAHYLFHPHPAGNGISNSARECDAIAADACEHTPGTERLGRARHCGVFDRP